MKYDSFSGAITVPEASEAVPTHMEIRNLRSFFVVAEEGHVTRAAKRLNMTQPGITQHIKALESELGVTLFTRLGRGVQITPAGRFLQKQAQGILDLVREVSDQTRQVGAANRKTIVVGLSNVETLSEVVTSVLKQFRTENPDTYVRALRVEADEVAQALREGRIDAAFSCAAVPDRHDISRLRLAVGKPMVAVPIDHPRAKQTSMSLGELANERLILISHGEVAGSFEVNYRRVCLALGSTPQVYEVTPDLLIALSLVAAGAGIALLPSSVVGTRADAIAYLPLTEAPELHVEFAMYLRRGEKVADLLSLKALIQVRQGT